MPDVPPFGNPFVFAFAYRCSQIRLRIHPFRTAVGRREQQPSCQTVMAETSSASLSPEVPRSLSDRTRIVAIGIWKYIPPYTASLPKPRHPDGPCPESRQGGEGQTANTARPRANRQAVVCNGSKNRRPARRKIILYSCFQQYRSK